MKYEQMLKSLKEERAFSQERKDKGPRYYFQEKVAQSARLYLFVEKSAKSKENKLNARKNYIINLVSASEVYFKDTLRIVPDFKKVRARYDGFSELLNEKITIWEAYCLLKQKRTGLGDLLAVGRTFSNLETIDSAFSKALNCDFLNDIESNECSHLTSTGKKFFEVKKFQLKKVAPNWRKEVGKLFSLRNEFVHQISFTDHVTSEQVSNYWWNLVCLVHASEFLLLDKYK